MNVAGRWVRNISKYHTYILVILLSTFTIISLQDVGVLAGLQTLDIILARLQGEDIILQGAGDIQRLGHIGPKDMPMEC